MTNHAANHASGLRMVRLLLFVARAGGTLGFAELTSRLGVSPRTVQRYVGHLAQIRDARGQPLVEQVGGGRHNDEAHVRLGWWPHPPQTYPTHIRSHADGRIGEVTA